MFAMEITFKNKKLQQACNNYTKLVKQYGRIRADKISIRLNQLRDADTLEDVRYLAGNYHQLKHNRAGQWACDLDQPNRLIFEPHSTSINTQIIGSNWKNIKGIEIIEISNYHKEK